MSKPYTVEQHESRFYVVNRPLNQWHVSSPTEDSAIWNAERMNADGRVRKCGERITWPAPDSGCTHDLSTCKNCGSAEDVEFYHVAYDGNHWQQYACRSCVNAAHGETEYTRPHYTWADIALGGFDAILQSHTSEYLSLKQRGLDHTAPWQPTGINRVQAIRDNLRDAMVAEGLWPTSPKAIAASPDNDTHDLAIVPATCAQCGGPCTGLETLEGTAYCDECKEDQMPDDIKAMKISPTVFVRDETHLRDLAGLPQRAYDPRNPMPSIMDKLGELAKGMGLTAGLLLFLALSTGASAKPGPTVTRELPASCEITIEFEDRSKVATCEDGTSYGWDPTYRFWDERTPYIYVGTDAAGVVHTVTMYE